MGILFPKIAEFPLWRSMEKQVKAWWTTSPSSYPVCLLDIFQRAANGPVDLAP